MMACAGSRPSAFGRSRSDTRQQLATAASPPRSRKVCSAVCLSSVFCVGSAAVNQPSNANVDCTCTSELCSRHRTKRWKSWFEGAPALFETGLHLRKRDIIADGLPEVAAPAARGDDSLAAS